MNERQATNVPMIAKWEQQGEREVRRRFSNKGAA